MIKKKPKTNEELQGNLDLLKESGGCRAAQHGYHPKAKGKE